MFTTTELFSSSFDTFDIEGGILGGDYDTDPVTGGPGEVPKIIYGCDPDNGEGYELKGNMLTGSITWALFAVSILIYIPLCLYFIYPLFKARNDILLTKVNHYILLYL